MGVMGDGGGRSITAALKNKKTRNVINEYVLYMLCICFVYVLYMFCICFVYGGDMVEIWLECVNV